MSPGMATKPLLPLLAALGVAVSAHVGLLAAWGHLEVEGRGKAAMPTPAVAMQWRWRHISASAVTASHQAVVRPPTPSTPSTPSHEVAAQAPSRPAADAQAEAATPVSTANTSAQPEHFWQSSDLDFRALPMAAPDTTPLHGIAWGADRPLRLRLSITAQGQVVDVVSLDAEPPPADVLAALEAMFKSTPFMPARRRGQDVASLQNIDIAP